MLFDPSSTIIAMRSQRMGFDQVRLDGPVRAHRPARVGRTRPAAMNGRWRFDLLQLRAA